MNVKQAVQVAKDYVADMFGDEGITDVGLEEIEFESGGYWQITIGFSRPWSRNVGPVLGNLGSRTYKTIKVRDKDGNVLSIKDRSISTNPYSINP